MGDVFDHFHQFTRVIMLAFHHADWPHRLAAHSLFDHREQDLLFFHHVAGQLFMQHGQALRQATRYRGFLGMNALHFGRLQDQFRQLFAVAVMVTHDDVIDDLCQCHVAPVFFQRLLSQFCQFSFDEIQIQFLTRCRTRQGLLTATAVIHIVFTKQRGSAWDGERQLA